MPTVVVANYSEAQTLPERIERLRRTVPWHSKGKAPIVFTDGTNAVRQTDHSLDSPAVLRISSLRPQRLESCSG